jgi:hypothetical protein
MLLQNKIEKTGGIKAKLFNGAKDRRMGKAGAG